MSEAFTKLKRGTVHPETGERFWRYHRGRENWVSPERFDSLQQAAAIYRSKNPDKSIEASRRWRLENPERFRSAIVRWNQDNQERVKRTGRVYRVRTRDKRRAQRNERRRIDPHFKILTDSRCVVCTTLRTCTGARGTPKFTKLVGCTLPEFKRHLERQFTHGMSWENYGTFWEVDHIKAASRFDVTKPAELVACFHFSNLRPLTGSANRSKQAKLVV